MTCWSCKCVELLVIWMHELVALWGVNLNVTASGIHLWCRPSSQKVLYLQHGMFDSSLGWVLYPICIMLVSVDDFFNWSDQVVMFSSGGFRMELLAHKLLLLSTKVCHRSNLVEHDWTNMLNRIPQFCTRRTSSWDQFVLNFRCLIATVASAVTFSYIYAGYDVFLGNFRGLASREHVNPNISARR